MLYAYNCLYLDEQQRKFAECSWRNCSNTLIHVESKGKSIGRGAGAFYSQDGITAISEVHPFPSSWFVWCLGAMAIR